MILESGDGPATYRAIDSIGYLLRRAHRMSVVYAEEAFAGEELGFLPWIALIQLRDGLADTAGALSRCIGHDSGAMTRMLDQLEERGLIRRERSMADRRVIHLRLTADGIAAADRPIPRMLGLWDRLLDGFAPEEVTQLTSLLQRLVARLERGDGEGAMS